MSTGCSGNCPGCKRRQSAEGTASSLIQIVAGKLKAGSETAAVADESTARGLLAAEILAHATSFVL
jgi:hypothetical protein